MKALAVLTLFVTLSLASSAQAVVSVCIAKNSDFIGQTFPSGTVPKPDLVAVTDALTKCVEWSANDLAHRNPGKCYIAGCSPVVLIDGDTIEQILANLIAQVIGPG